ncbi:hypothetical protein D5278_12050 [bacterium 1XD21-13]|nr:hypothetical protein [bacterium 1XD21-13]
MDYQGNYPSLGPGFEPNTLKAKKGIPLPIFLLLLASLILAGFSMARFPKSLSEYRIFEQAEARTKNGETIEALQELFEVLEEHPNSLPVILELMDLSMGAGYYDQAAYVFNEYLVGQSLTDSQYARMMRYSRRLDSYYATYDAIDALFAQLEMEEDYGEETSDRLTQQLKEELSRLHRDSSQDQAFLYYYDAMLTENLEEQRDLLKKSYEADPELFDTRVLLANAERGLGNLADAHAYLEEAVSKESQDAGALRGLAVLAMLEEEEAKALAMAQAAYEVNPDGLYVRDTYLVALHVNGHRDEENALIEEIEELEGALEEDTRQLLDGELTLQEYYMGG